MGLIHAGMNTSAGLSDAYTSLSLLSRVFLCCKLKASAILVLSSATGHRRQRYDRSRIHSSLLRDACMLIMIKKLNMHAYLKR